MDDIGNLSDQLNLYKDVEGKKLEKMLHCCMTDLFGENTAAVVNNGCFVLTGLPSGQDGEIVGVDQSGCFLIPKDNYALANDAVLSARSISLGKEANSNARIWINKSDTYASKIFDFKKRLLVLEQEWINNYAFYLKKFLASRISEGISIIKYDAVRLEWAGLVEKQKSLESNINSFENDMLTSIQNDGFNFARRLVRECCEHLCRLAGGRAFILGQAVDRLWLFEIVNKIYLTEGDDCG